MRVRTRRFRSESEVRATSLQERVSMAGGLMGV
jgi:hypothetical protein